MQINWLLFNLVSKMNESKSKLKGLIKWKDMTYVTFTKTLSEYENENLWDSFV